MKYNILINGPVGTGKTYSVHTLLDAGKELFILATEPGLETILGEWEKDFSIDMSRVHYAKVFPGTVDWDTLQRNAEVSNTMTMAQLQNSPSINKMDFKQFIEVYKMLAGFVDQNGEEFGAVDDWDDSRALVIDSLSGLSRMALNLVVGVKPAPTQPEWGCAMGNLLNLIRKLTDDTKCTFVLLAHTEKEINELTGGTHLTVSTLGRKLAPQIVKLFDEIVYAKRDGEKFKWSTTEAGIDLKSRRLPWADDIAPDFAQMFEE